jgi:hypothetical protein
MQVHRSSPGRIRLAIGDTRVSDRRPHACFLGRSVTGRTLASRRRLPVQGGTPALVLSPKSIRPLCASLTTEFNGKHNPVAA